MEKKTTKGKTISIIVGSIAFIIAYVGVQALFKKDPETQLQQLADKMNQQTPMQVDADTRLDSVATGKANIDYYYTLIHNEKSTINTALFKEQLMPNLVERVKFSPDLANFRKHNITMGYHYYDANGEYINAILVTPELYQEP